MIRVKRQLTIAWDFGACIAVQKRKFKGVFCTVQAVGALLNTENLITITLFPFEDGFWYRSQTIWTYFIETGW